jgi:hypothetical protein
MKYFVAVISPKFPENYDRCKLLELWGMTNKKPDAELVMKGDKLLFYIGRTGFVSEAIIQEGLRELSGNDWKPYDQREFKWGFNIKLTEEYKKARLYKFPNGTNPTLGIKTSDLMFKGFFEISKSQYELIKKGEGANLTDKDVESQNAKNIINTPSRTTVGELINHEGLIFGPVNEQGVIFLFSKLQKELGIIIESIQTGFPDARGRIKTKRGWQEIWIEFEYRASSYLTHGHPTTPGYCDYIICWENDWRKPPEHITILELKSELSKLSGGSSSKMLSFLV